MFCAIIEQIYFVSKIYTIRLKSVNVFVLFTILSEILHNPKQYDDIKSFYSNQIGFISHLRWKKNQLNNIPWRDNSL